MVHYWDTNVFTSRPQSQFMYVCTRVYCFKIFKYTNTCPNYFNYFFKKMSYKLNVVGKFIWGVRSGNPS